jgi:hypothetical protein
MEKRSNQEYEERHLLPIEALENVRVAEDDPDVRGWKVLTAHHRVAGEVHTLIADEARMKVRYLDVAINRDFLDGDGREGHHVLIPIGMARLDTQDRRVILDDFNLEDLIRLPTYDHGPVSGEYERRLRDTLMAEGKQYEAEDFYSQEFFDHERFYNRRGELG